MCLIQSHSTSQSHSNNLQNCLYVTSGSLSDGGSRLDPRRGAMEALVTKKRGRAPDHEHRNVQRPKPVTLFCFDQQTVPAWYGANSPWTASYVRNSIL